MSAVLALRLLATLTGRVHGGVQVYVMEIEATVAECAARNVHGRTRDEVALLAQEYEETPRRFLRLEGLDK
eukprot:2467182-Rhodomonas_salina.1